MATDEPVPLHDIIPNPSTREFLGWIYHHSGRSAAVALTRAFADGTLVDMGPVEVEQRDEPAPMAVVETEQGRLW